MSDAQERTATPAPPGGAEQGGAPRVMTPAPEQRAAIEDRARDLFLSAGAGTGKTSVLVERFCDAVCATEGEDAEVGVENVLAFTFTERAAGELKRRIRTELGRRAETAGDPERARRLRSLARDSESAWISTIHSFCQRVLAADPLGAGLDPGFRVLDEPAAGRIAAEAFDDAFERFGAGGGDDRFELAAAYRLSGLRTLVRTAHDELRSRGLERAALPAVGPPDLAGAATELREAATAALAATEGAKASGRFHECRGLLAEAAAGTEGRVPEEDEVVGWGFESSAKGLDLEEVRRYHVARRRLEQRLVEARFADRYEQLCELLILFGEEYRRRKDERSVLDFEDLQVRVRTLLRADADARRRYQRRFQHLMVDELQDTNRLQLAIVRLLHVEDGVRQNRLFTVGDELQSIYGFRHADVEVFRAERARAEEANADEVGVRRLAGNFRSRPEVLALVNRVGRAMFGPNYEELTAAALPDGLEAPREPVVEVLATEREGWDEPDAPAIEISPDERAQPWRVAEARFLAERLRALHGEGVKRGDMVVLLRSFGHVEAYEDALESAGLSPYVVGGRGYWSKQQVADVRNLLGCVANPLDEKALFGALASPACGVCPDTLWLLRQAAGGASAWSAVSWLFGPAPAGGADGGTGSRREGADRDAPTGGGGAGEDGREAWRRHAEDLARHVPEEDARALRGFAEALARLRAEAPLLSLEALIDRVITATGYDLALLMRPRGRRRMANVRKLMRLGREFEAVEGRDLRAFLDFAAGQAEDDGREAEAAVDAEGHDGVRVMTVHAAKGLEFPVVAVADLGRGLSAGFPPLLRLEPSSSGAADEEDQAMRVGLRLARLGRKQTPVFDYQELQDRAVEREREEERRILHVAATRARRRLILSGAFSLEKLAEDPKPTEPLIAGVLRALDWTPGRASVDLEPAPRRPGLGEDLRPVAAAVLVRAPGEPGEEPSQPGAGAPCPGWLASSNGDETLADPNLAPPVTGEGAPVRAVSYSALSLFERCGYRFYAERVLGLRPRLPRRRAAAGPAADGETAAGREPGDDEREPALRGGGDEWHAGDDADGLASRYARGRVVHRLLEESARQGFAPPASERVEALLRGEGVEAVPSQVGRTTDLVEAFLRAPLRSELDAAARLKPESPFAFRVGGLVVRGEIDLLADLGSEILILDYKSDALGGTAPTDHMERYEVQRRIYALAALRRHGKPVRVLYLFLERPGEPVEARFDPADAARLTAELASMGAAVTAGRYEVTPEPERSLCFDCPARERLCVHGPELTLRERAG